MPCDRCVGEPFGDACRHEPPKDRRQRSFLTPPGSSPAPDPFDPLQAERHEKARRLGFIPGTECLDHPGYPLPCDKHARIATDAT